MRLLPILATIYEVKITFWKKLVEGAPITYFQIIITHDQCLEACTAVQGAPLLKYNHV
jgi:hypothetical protein